jgi:hypothetical protein
MTTTIRFYGLDWEWLVTGADTTAWRLALPDGGEILLTKPDEPEAPVTGGLAALTRYSADGMVLGWAGPFSFYPGGEAAAYHTIPMLEEI